MSRSDRPFHELLREFREQRRMSPRDAARRAGVSVEVWGDYEAGRALPSRLALHKVFGTRCALVHRLPEALPEVPPPPVAPEHASLPPLPPFAVDLKRARENADASLEELAGAAGVPAVDLAAAEGGQPLRPDHVAALANLLPELAGYAPAPSARPAPPSPPPPAPAADDTGELLRRIRVAVRALRGAPGRVTLALDEEGAGASVVVFMSDGSEEIESNGGTPLEAARAMLAGLRAELDERRRAAERQLRAIEEAFA